MKAGFTGNADSPPWQRRGGCALKKTSRSVLSRAQTGWFVQARDNRKVERTTPSALVPTLWANLQIAPDLSVRLFRKPVPGGSEEQIRISDEVRMGDVPIASNAINKDGKILVATALDQVTWYWEISIFDPKTGRAKRIATDFLGDILYAGWTADAQVLAMGVNTEGSIWRLRPQDTGP